MKNIQEYERNRLKQFEEQEQRQKELKKHLSTLRSKLEYERSRDTQTRLEHLTKIYNEDLAKIAQLRTNFEALSKEIASVQADSAVLEQESKDAERSMEELEEVLTGLNRAKNELKQNISQFKKRTEVEHGIVSINLFVFF